MDFKYSQIFYWWRGYDAEKFQGSCLLNVYVDVFQVKILWVTFIHLIFQLSS